MEALPFFIICLSLQRVSGGDLLSIPNVAINSAGMCDVDIRPVSQYSIKHYWTMYSGAVTRVFLFYHVKDVINVQLYVGKEEGDYVSLRPFLLVSVQVLNVYKVEDLIDNDVMHGMNGPDLPTLFMCTVQNRTVGRSGNEATSYV